MTEKCPNCGSRNRMANRIPNVEGAEIEYSGVAFEQLLGRCPDKWHERPWEKIRGMDNWLSEPVDLGEPEDGGGGG